MSEIEMYKALIEAGVSEERAQAAVDNFVRDQDVATKADVAQLKSYMETRTAQQETRMT